MIAMTLENSRIKAWKINCKTFISANEIPGEKIQYVWIDGELMRSDVRTQYLMVMILVQKKTKERNCVADMTVSALPK